MYIRVVDPLVSLKKILRKSNFKATPSRIAVLEVFKKTRKPISAQEIISALSRSVNQATVYRTLKLFKTKEIIKQIDLRQNHAHYELADLMEHHHIICLGCGRVEDIHYCWINEMEPIIRRSSRHFAEITQHALEFYGICKACKKRSDLPARHH